MKTIHYIPHIFFLCLVSSWVSGATIRVPSEYPTIQAGIDAATDGDTVLVADGTYSGDGNRDIVISSGKAIVLTSENGAEHTIIDCDGTSEDNHRGFYIEYEVHENTVIRGFKIIDGFYDKGGGIYCRWANPTIEQCTITQNIAKDEGGGIWLENSSNTTEISDCVISGNYAGGSGGGLHIYGKGVFHNCEFNDNSADIGGGLFCDCSYSYEVQIYSCQFVGNKAETWGGGIHCNSSTTVGGSPAESNYFSGNSAGSGADLFCCEIPAPVIKARYNNFSGYFPSDYYVSPKEAFNLQHCTSELTPVTQDVYVSPTGDDNNSGLSWDTAFKTIRHALSVVYGTSSDPLAIRIKPGSYSPSETGEIYPLPMIDYVSIVGENRDTVMLNAEQTARVFVGYHDQNLKVSNVTITGGITPELGGGIYCVYDSSPRIENCTISYNTVIEDSGDGGGCYISGSSEIYRSNICFNSGANGGGIFCSDSVKIIDCVISNNEASSMAGGICCTNSESVIINDCSIIDNSAVERGGGIGVWTSSPLISNCIISWNSANRGGGCYSFSMDHLTSNGKFTNTFISENSAENGGGLYFTGIIKKNCIFNKDKVDNCLVIENYASNKGGGIWLGEVEVTIRGSTIAGNWSADSGGIYYNNTPKTNIENCIVWDNNPQEISGSFDPLQIRYSDIRGGWEGEGNIALDPLFVTSEEYYLSHAETGHPEDSPCINTGSDQSDNICFSIPSGDVCMDQFTTRTDEVTDTGIVDMGYHYVPSSFSTPTPIPTSTPSPRPTVTPCDPTFTPINTNTPHPTQPPGSPTWTPTPTITPTPLTGLSVTLEMPNTYFSPGDICWLKAYLENEVEVLTDIPLFVILDVYSNYWFWDSWTQQIDFVVIDVSLGRTEKTIIDTFTWPDTGGQSMTGLVFWGALTNPEMTEILGEHDRIEFGYGP